MGAVKGQRALPGLGRIPRQAPIPVGILAPPDAPAEGGSYLERAQTLQLHDLGAPAPVREYRFDRTRMFRFDVAWPELMVACEVQGAVWGTRHAACGGKGCARCHGSGWVPGRHTSPAGFAAEVVKRRCAAVAGWCVLEWTGEEVTRGQAARETAQVLADRARRAASERARHGSQDGRQDAGGIG